MQENRQRVILEEKRRKREEARKAAAEKKAASKGQAAAPPEEEEGCVIDNLLKEIRSGTTLRPTQRKPTHRAPQLSAKELEHLKKIAAQVVDGSSTLQDAVGEEGKEREGGGREEGGKKEGRDGKQEGEKRGGGGEREGEDTTKEVEPKPSGNEEVVTKPAASSIEANDVEPPVDKPHPPTDKPHPSTEPPANQSGGVVSNGAIETKDPPSEAGASDEVSGTVVQDKDVQRERGGQAEKMEVEEIPNRSLSPIERRLRACSPDQVEDNQVLAVDTRCT